MVVVRAGMFVDYSIKYLSQASVFDEEIEIIMPDGSKLSLKKKEEE